MRIFRRIGRVIAGAGHLAASAFMGAVALVSASLDFALRTVSRLYDRFDARWAELGREARARHIRDGRRTIDPVNLD